MSVNVTTKSNTRLTNDTANQNTPTYIAATKRIGYVSDQDEEWDLYSSDLTGNNVIKVFYEKDVVVSEATWSPDGNTIHFRWLKTARSRLPIVHSPSIQ